MRVPPNLFRRDETHLNKDLDQSDSFLLSSSNSITIARKKEQSLAPEIAQFESCSIVHRFYELDPNVTAQIVAECEGSLQAKLLIEFPIFPLNDDFVKVLSAIIAQKVEALK
jgi:hypothetical protein